MDTVNVLVMTEVLEFVIPLGYLACFLATYYGQNAEILGNIRNSYWQNQGVEDINNTIENVLLLAFIDVVSLLVSATILWFKFQINLINVSMLMGHFSESYSMILVAPVNCNSALTLALIRLLRSFIIFSSSIYTFRGNMDFILLLNKHI